MLTLNISKKYFREVVLVPALSSIAYSIVSVIIIILPFFLIATLLASPLSFNIRAIIGNLQQYYYALLFTAMLFILVMVAVLLNFVFYDKQNQRMAEATELYLQNLSNPDQKEEMDDGFRPFESNFESKVSFFRDFNFARAIDLLIYTLKISLFAIISSVFFIFFIFYSFFSFIQNNETGLSTVRISDEAFLQNLGSSILLVSLSSLILIISTIYTWFQVGKKGHGMLAIIEGVDRSSAWTLSTKTIGKNFWTNAFRYFICGLILLGINFVLDLIRQLIGRIFNPELFGVLSGFINEIIGLIFFIISAAISTLVLNFGYIANKNLLSLEENEEILKEYQTEISDQTSQNPV